jgi:hypothetical protein
MTSAKEPATRACPPGAEHAAQLADPAATRTMMLDALETYFGPKTRARREFHPFVWGAIAGPRAAGIRFRWAF